MIRGKSYYFFCLERIPDDPYPEYRIATSREDLSIRFGHHYLRKFYKITRLNEVTIEHLRAIDEFLLQQIS